MCPRSHHEEIIPVGTRPLEHFVGLRWTDCHRLRLKKSQSLGNVQLDERDLDLVLKVLKFLDC